MFSALAMPIFDILVQTDDAFLAKPGHDQGCHATDRRGARRLDLRRHGAGDPGLGGSAANTIVGVAAFGANAVYVGKSRTTRSARCTAMTSRG